MAMSSEALEKELLRLKKDVQFIKHVLSESDDLSDEAKIALRTARETPESEYADL